MNEYGFEGSQKTCLAMELGYIPKGRCKKEECSCYDEIDCNTISTNGTLD